MSDKAWVEMTRQEQRVEVARLQSTYPVGTRVKVVASDPETEDAYVGKTGRVRGYDFGNADSPPLVSVRFDKPHGKQDGDGFYPDEIEVLP